LLNESLQADGKELGASVSVRKRDETFGRLLRFFFCLFDRDGSLFVGDLKACVYPFIGCNTIWWLLCVAF
jgi:hypothetical protein